MPKSVQAVLAEEKYSKGILKPQGQKNLRVTITKMGKLEFKSISLVELLLGLLKILVLDRISLPNYNNVFAN